MVPIIALRTELCARDMPWMARWRRDEDQVVARARGRLRGATLAVNGGREWTMETKTIEGRLLSAAGRSLPEGIRVWFAYRTVDGDATTLETTADVDARFAFDLPDEQLQSATVGAALDGVVPVDLEPTGAPLEPGTVVLVVDDLVPSHLRYGCC
jgi:hypothetical protein